MHTALESILPPKPVSDSETLTDGGTFVALPKGDKAKPWTGTFGKGLHERLTTDERVKLSHLNAVRGGNRALLCGGARVEMPDGSFRAVVVFDIDVKPATATRAAQTGPATLAKVEAELGSLPGTLTCVTPSGGQHRYFWAPNDLSVSNKVLARPFGGGLEFQNDGQYVVFPGSTLDPEISARMGYIAGLYRWKDPSTPIAQLPTEYVEWFKAHATAAVDTGEWTPVPLCEWDQERRVREATNYLTNTAPLSIRGEGGRDKMFCTCAVLMRKMRLPLDVAGDLIESVYNSRLLSAGTTAWSRSDPGPHGMCIDERLESAAATSVAADDVGSHYHRNHRYPGTHPLARRRFFAMSYRAAMRTRVVRWVAWRCGVRFPLR